MPVATETVFLHFRAGANPHDASSSTAQQLKKSCATVSEQKGFVRQHWGTQLENQSVLVWTIDWDNVQDHKDFINSESYKPFIADQAPSFDFEAVKPFMIHTHFTSDTAIPQKAPVTECTFSLLPADANELQKSALEDALLSLLNTATTKGSATGYACGWVLEELSHEGGVDGKAIGLQALIGWPSEEDHVAFRNNPDYLKASKSMTDLALPTKGYLSTCHVKMHGKR